MECGKDACENGGRIYQQPGGCLCECPVPYTGMKCTEVSVLRLSPKLSSFKHFYYKKAARIFNFCLIGNICHNFLVPRMIESAPKTFMPIQTSDLHRVIVEKCQFCYFCPNL